MDFLSKHMKGFAKLFILSHMLAHPKRLQYNKNHEEKKYSRSWLQFSTRVQSSDDCMGQY